MTFEPAQNRILAGLLTEDERDVLRAAKHGWERFHNGIWRDCPAPVWHSGTVYRAKPAPKPTIIVNGIEVPEPVREGLETNAEYWLADPTLMPSYKRRWDGFPVEIKWLNSGLIHQSKDAADAHAKAMLAPSMRGDV